MVNTVQRILAVIPARGGSKGVPRKNIKMLNGRPLIAYTIDQARNVSELDLIVVSTEDAEIKSVAEECGVQVIDRPLTLATDMASTESVLLHVLDSLEAQGESRFDYVVVLEPTSPLRTANTIRACIITAIRQKAVSLLTVRKTHENIGTIEGGFFKPLAPGAPRRRQDRQPFFIESSTIYICRTDYLRKTGTLVAENWMAYVVPDSEAYDINTLDDFIRIECLMQAAQENQ